MMLLGVDKATITVAITQIILQHKTVERNEIDHKINKCYG